MARDSRSRLIQRVVFVRLAREYQTDGDRELIAEHTRQVLGGISLVRHLVVGVAGDSRARRDWDLVILARFEDLAAVEEYRTEKTHRAYVDVYLRPMLGQIRVWNFEIPEPDSF